MAPLSECYPYSALAVIRGFWEGEEKFGIGTAIDTNAVITARINVVSDKIPAQRIELFFPDFEGPGVSFEGRIKDKTPIDPHIELIEFIEKDPEMDTYGGYFLIAHVDAWKRKWVGKKLFLLGISTSFNLEATEIIDPKIESDGFFHYKMDFVNGQIGSPICFQIDQSRREWTIIGVHIGIVEGEGIAQPISRNLTLDI